jgi:FeS assembly SUF system regulator
MIRIAKLTDYGIVLLTHFVRAGEVRMLNAPDLAREAKLPLPTVSKLLKLLVRAGLLVSHRGVAGGYSLARRPTEVTVAQVIAALEGPIAVTECSSDAHGLCTLESSCPTQGNWRKINTAVRRALDDLTLADMVAPVAEAPAEDTLLALRVRKTPSAGLRL